MIFVLRDATSLGLVMDARVMFEPRNSGPLTVIDCILLSLSLFDDKIRKLRGLMRPHESVEVVASSVLSLKNDERGGW